MFTAPTRFAALRRLVAMLALVSTFGGCAHHDRSSVALIDPVVRPSGDTQFPARATASLAGSDRTWQIVVEPYREELAMPADTAITVVTNNDR